MCSVFLKEEEVLAKAQKILEQKSIETKKDEVFYSELVEEYKGLLNQMKRVIKISDIIEAKLNSVFHSVDEIAKIDYLTELYNRRVFNEFLEKEFSRCKSPDVSVIMIDIDSFKCYNDRYGHIEGDKCLQAVSDVLKKIINNPQHVAARYGGEEFIILLPGLVLGEAVKIAENIRKSVEALQIEHKGNKECEIVTVSVGVAAMSSANWSTSEKLIDRADKALYKAKESGRNKVAF